MRPGHPADALRLQTWSLCRGGTLIFLRKERPLALLLQLGGVCLLAYDLPVTDPHVSGGAALVGFAVFLVGALLSRMRM